MLCHPSPDVVCAASHGTPPAPIVGYGLVLLLVFVFAILPAILLRNVGTEDRP